MIPLEFNRIESSNFREARRQWYNGRSAIHFKGKTMPSAAFGTSPALPLTALSEVESGPNTELLTAGVGCSEDVALPTLAVSATPCIVRSIILYQAVAPLLSWFAPHGAKECVGLRSFRRVSIAGFRHIHSPFQW